MITERDALLSAIEFCEGQVGLARRLTEIIGKEISQQRIWNILHRGQRVPAELVLPIERATAAKVTRHQLRPDLYPLDDDTVSARDAAPPQIEAAQ